MQRVGSDEFELRASPPALDEDEVHVWLLSLDGGSDHRAVATAAHALLGRWLVHYAGLDAPPAFARTHRGKPYAPSLPGLDFNLSHARDHVLIAFARNQPLGVDLERIDRKIETDDLARRFFAPSEAEALASLPAEHRLVAFLRLWTCKEAVLKALGEGIGFGLDRVAFAVDTDGVPAGLAALASEAGPAAAWRLVLLEPAPGFLGALAWQGPARRVRTFRTTTA